MGARPLRRLIQDEIEDEISELYLTGDLIDGDIARISAKRSKSGDRSISITHDKRNRERLEANKAESESQVALPASR